jgi:hypothetical protein
LLYLTKTGFLFAGRKCQNNKVNAISRKLRASIAKTCQLSWRSRNAAGAAIRSGRGETAGKILYFVTLAAYRRDRRVPTTQTKSQGESYNEMRTGLSEKSAISHSANCHRSILNNVIALI